MIILIYLSLNVEDIRYQVVIWIFHCICIEWIPIRIHFRTLKSIERNNEAFPNGYTKFFERTIFIFSVNPFLYFSVQ